VSFVRILTDWGEEQIELLLKNAYQALTPNGMVLIVEPIHEESSEMGESSAISGLMMALLGGGRRTVNDFMRFLSKAGFTELSCTDLEWALYRLISAERLDKIFPLKPFLKCCQYNYIIVHWCQFKKNCL